MQVLTHDLQNIWQCKMLKKRFTSVDYSTIQWKLKVRKGGQVEIYRDNWSINKTFKKEF